MAEPKRVPQWRFGLPELSIRRTTDGDARAIRPVQARNASVNRNTKAHSTLLIEVTLKKLAGIAIFNSDLQSHRQRWLANAMLLSGCAEFFELQRET